MYDRFILWYKININEFIMIGRVVNVPIDTIKFNCECVIQTGFYIYFLYILGLFY